MELALFVVGRTFKNICKIQTYFPFQIISRRHSVWLQARNHGFQRPLGSDGVKFFSSFTVESGNLSSSSLENRNPSRNLVGNGNTSRNSLENGNPSRNSLENENPSKNSLENRNPSRNSVENGNPQSITSDICVVEEKKELSKEEIMEYWKWLINKGYVKKKFEFREKRTPKKRVRLSIEAKLHLRIERAREKESLVLEELKNYVQEFVLPGGYSPVNLLDVLTEQELLHYKRLGMSNRGYISVGRRGVYEGVILNMNMQFKRAEVIKVFCSHSTPDQIREHAENIAKITGAIPIHFYNKIIIFYRGKNYVRPKHIKPKGILKKRKALIRGRLMQCLHEVRRTIAITETQLEIYHRHQALSETIPKHKTKSLNATSKHTHT